MLKQGNHKGFTIIEVVITIAIGAAVMALVLNAVAGARRSQRNNARVADVGAIAAAVNNYYGSRNTLPDQAVDIDDPLIGQLAYYPDANATEIADNFPEKIYTNAITAADGNFVEYGGTAAARSGTTIGKIGAVAVPACLDGATCGAGITEFTADHLTIVVKAACNADFSGMVAGGIREMALVYKLEGQSGIICREI